MIVVAPTPVNGEETVSTMDAARVGRNNLPSYPGGMRRRHR
jgi:hypothetical protein